MRVVDAAAMQAADARAVARIGDVALMRAAGLGIATILRHLDCGDEIVAFAGSGNNGGDAFAACAELAQHARCTVYAREPAAPSDGRRDAEARARAAGVRIEALPNDEASALVCLTNANCVVDGLLGVGGRNDTSAFAHIIRAMNATRGPVYALDLPSGIDATSGLPSQPETVRASTTITLGVPKRGLLAASARSFVGSLWLVDIGIGEHDFETSDVPLHEMLTSEEFQALLPVRDANGDKRASGAPLLIAGSEQFPGAAVLCAMGAARAGAGYVTVATPKAAALPLRMHLVEQVVVGIDEDTSRAIDELVDLTNHCSAVGIGPGLGLHPQVGEIVRGFLQRTTLPVVIDASGFAHVVKHLDLLQNRPCVLTPHDSEFARLSGKGSIAEGTRVERLREFVERTGITTLLKGAVTLIYDGTRLTSNTSGTSALATAGTGDVLTGMIATLLSQGLTPYDAARIAAYWHGRAGRVAASVRSRGIMAGDLPGLLGQAAESDAIMLPGGCTKLF